MFTHAQQSQEEKSSFYNINLHGSQRFDLYKKISIDSSSTVLGIDFRLATVGKHTYKIWDLAGTEIFGPSACYTRNRAAVLLCPQDEKELLSLLADNERIFSKYPKDTLFMIVVGTNFNTSKCQDCPYPFIQTELLNKTIINKQLMAFAMADHKEMGADATAHQHFFRAGLFHSVLISEIKKFLPEQDEEVRNQLRASDQDIIENRNQFLLEIDNYIFSSKAKNMPVISQKKCIIM